LTALFGFLTVRVIFTFFAAVAARLAQRKYCGSSRECKSYFSHLIFCISFMGLTEKDEKGLN
jgi:hypothetical protein